MDPIQSWFAALTPIERVEFLMSALHSAKARVRELEDLLSAAGDAADNDYLKKGEPPAKADGNGSALSVSSLSVSSKILHVLEGKTMRRAELHGAILNRFPVAPT